MMLLNGTKSDYNEVHDIEEFYIKVHNTSLTTVFLQGVSVAASPVLATIGMSVCPSVCPSHAGTE